jgi:hypothetical protein
MTSAFRDRGFGVAYGLLTFAGAHAIETALWAAAFGGAHDPWFLNSGRAIVFTMACLFGTSVVAGLLGVPGLPITAGAVTAMVAVLFWNGGSTIFPIVLAAGALLIAFSCLLGAWLGKEVAGLLRRRRDS